MNYIIAVGYPLRLFPGEQGTEVEIELLNRTCLLKGVQAVIWGQLFQVQECPETWMPDILELYKSGAVVMGETQEELLLHLLPLHPLRQGFCIQDGVGRTKICLGGQLFPLSPVQEMLWRDANGSVTLQHMLQQNNLLTVTPEDLLHELILLTAADLYYFR